MLESLPAAFQSHPQDVNLFPCFVRPVRRPHIVTEFSPLTLLEASKKLQQFVGGLVALLTGFGDDLDVLVGDTLVSDRRLEKFLNLLKLGDSLLDLCVRFCRALLVLFDLPTELQSLEAKIDKLNCSSCD
jgi:hypothetical protein